MSEAVSRFASTFVAIFFLLSQLAASPLLVVGNPCGALSVVFKARCVLERVLCGVERQIGFVVLLSGFDRVETHSHVFLTGSKETADTDDCCIDLAALVDQKICN